MAGFIDQTVTILTRLARPVVLVGCAPLDFIVALVILLHFESVAPCTSALAVVFDAFVNMFSACVTFEGYETLFAFETVAVLQVQFAIIDCRYTLFLVVIGYYLTCNASATVS